MPTLTQLEYILAVQKHKHFGQASKSCFVSQPSLSIQIQKVEERLGFIIFDRSKKPILTTDKGKKFIDQARVILNEHKKLLEVGRSDDMASGKFNLGVIPTLSAYIVPLFIESFAKNHPDVELNILEHKTDDIISLLKKDELDGGLLVTPLKDDQIIEQHLFYEQFYVYISKGHKLSSKKKVKESDLSAADIWLLSEGHCFRNQSMKVCSSKTNNSALETINFESGSLETLKNLVKRGRGYTMLPYLATLDLSDYERDKLLKPFTGKVPTREVSLVYSRSFLKEGILQALQDEVLDNIPPEVKSLKRGNLDIIDI